MVEFRLDIQHLAPNEPDMNTFLVYIKDNYADAVQSATADSTTQRCLAGFVFITYSDMITALLDLRTKFSISYHLEVRK